MRGTEPESLSTRDQKKGSEELKQWKMMATKG